MKTAVIYARYSSDRQTEQSIEGQVRACTEYAERNDILIVSSYIDRAMTGTNDKRTQFQLMLKDSAKRAWDYVIVYKIDRFGRNKYEIAMNKNILKTNGIRLVSAMENIPDTPEGIILESLLEGMAEYYSAELSQKVRRGMNETRQKGNYTGGYLLYGYKKDGKKVVIDEDKAKVILRIYEQYAKNVYIKDIISSLTNDGILHKEKPFAKTTVHRILQNEKYAGVYKYKDEVFTDIYPQIVPTKLFNIVKEKNENNRYGSHSPYVNYILRKKIVCGYCGRTINGITGTSKTGKVNRYYSCSGRYLKKSCKKKSIRKESLEDVVSKALLKNFQNNETANIFADKIIEINKQRIADQTLFNILNEEKARLENSKRNIMLAIEQGIITNTTKDRLQELEMALDENATKILMEKTKSKMELSKDEILLHIKKALKNNANKLIDILVKEIKLYDDKIEIACNYANDKIENNQSLDMIVAEENVSLPISSDRNNSIIEMKNVKLKIKV